MAGQHGLDDEGHERALEQQRSDAFNAPLSFSAGPSKLFRGLAAPVSRLDDGSIAAVDLAVFLHGIAAHESIRAILSRSRFSPAAVSPEDILELSRILAALLGRLTHSIGKTMGAAAIM